MKPSEEYKKTIEKDFSEDDLDYVSRLDLEASKYESQLKSLKSKYWTYLGLGFAIILLSIFAGIFMPDRPTRDLLFYGDDPLNIIALGSLYGMLVAMGGYFLFQTRKSRTQADIDRVLAKKRILQRFEKGENIGNNSVENTGKVSYFDSLVTINVENLADYYSMVKIHTDNSFRVSLISGIIGFVLIITGLIIGFGNGQNAQTIAIISASSGVIVEFISGIFFYLYNQTVRQLKGYHDSLLSVQNVLLSFKILEDIDDGKDKTKMISQMMSYLIGKHDIINSPVEEESNQV